MADQAKKKASEALSRIGDWLKDQKAREHPTAGGYGTGTAGNAHLAEESRLHGEVEAINMQEKRVNYKKGLDDANSELQGTLGDISRRKQKLLEAKQNTYNDNFFNESHPDIEGRRRMLDKAMASADARMDAAMDKRRGKHQALNREFFPVEDAHYDMSSRADSLGRTGRDLNREQIKKIASELKKPKPLGRETADRLLNEGADEKTLQARREGNIVAGAILGHGAVAAGAAYRSSWSQKKDAERK